MPVESSCHRSDDYRVGEGIEYLLKRSALSLENAINHELAAYGLTHSQFGILVMIRAHGCATAAYLVRELGMESSAVTRMLDRLERKNIVLRVRSTKDRRIAHIHLTDIGGSLVEKMPAVIAGVINRCLHDFSIEEFGQLKVFLRRMNHDFVGNCSEANEVESIGDD